jgi:hypothetical protein
MNETVGGKRRWYVPDAYLPSGEAYGAVSHESACLLNAGEVATRVRFTFFFMDRDPLGPIERELPARRAWHVRLDDPAVLDGLELPRDVPYAYMVESDEPVVLQHSRLDTAPGRYTLFTSIAYGE